MSGSLMEREAVEMTFCCVLEASTVSLLAILEVVIGVRKGPAKPLSAPAAVSNSLAASHESFLVAIFGGTPSLPCSEA